MQDSPLHKQISELENILSRSSLIQEVLRRAPALEMPNWYLGAGAIAQTVWNDHHGFSLDHGIKDCDLVYFDPDISAEAQDGYKAKGKRLFATLTVEVEITNEARVHLWYKQERGKEIRQYHSTEDAINTWPTTATSVGVRYEGDDFIVYAPYGLHDLLNMIVRPNKTLLTYEVYEQKTKRWKNLWPKLIIIDW